MSGAFKIGDRVKLTAAARAEVWKTWDIGTRGGTVVLIDRWIVVRWDGLRSQTHLPASDLEPMA